MKMKCPHCGKTIDTSVTHSNVKKMTWNELNSVAVAGDKATCGAFDSTQFIQKSGFSLYDGNWVPFFGAETACEWTLVEDWVLIDREKVKGRKRNTS